MKLRRFAAAAISAVALIAVNIGVAENASAGSTWSVVDRDTKSQKNGSTWS